GRIKLPQFSSARAIIGREIQSTPEAGKMDRVRRPAARMNLDHLRQPSDTAIGGWIELPQFGSAEFVVGRKIKPSVMRNQTGQFTGLECGKLADPHGARLVLACGRIEPPDRFGTRSVGDIKVDLAIQD